jgi:hypothetical protein
MQRYGNEDQRGKKDLKRSQSMVRIQARRVGSQTPSRQCHIGATLGAGRRSWCFLLALLPTKEAGLSNYSDRSAVRQHHTSSHSDAESTAEHLLPILTDSAHLMIPPVTYKICPPFRKYVSLLGAEMGRKGREDKRCSQATYSIYSQKSRSRKSGCAISVSIADTSVALF